MPQNGAAKILYLEVASALAGRIRSGILSPGDRIPTEKELCLEFGVSRITVRSALDILRRNRMIRSERSKGTFVLHAPAEPQVAEIPEDTPIHPFSRILALIFPVDASHVHGSGGMHPMLMGIIKQAERAGYFVTVHNSEKSIAKERHLLTELLRNRIGGIILYSNSDTANLDLLVRFSKMRFPLVLVDSLPTGVDLDVVLSDNLTGGRIQADLLSEEGAETFYYVTQSTEQGSMLEMNSTVMERYLGFCSRLAETESAMDASLVQPLLSLPTAWLESMQNEGSIAEPGFSMMKDCIKRFTGVLSTSTGTVGFAGSNDYVAWAIRRILARIDIAESSSAIVVGFDDLPAFSSNFPMSTVRQDFERIGREAVDLVVERISNRNRSSRIRKIPVEGIHRSTMKIMIKGQEDV